MNVRLRKPTDRRCEECGRHEQWDDDEGVWRVVREDGEPKTGSVFCLHEWDINGTFIPFEEAGDAAEA
jgi:hypothetical protein